MLLTQKDSAAEMISGGSFNATLKGLGVTSDPELLAAIQSAFAFNPASPPTYIPYNVYLNMIDYVRSVRLAHLPVDMAYELVGRVTVMAYFEGATGGIIKTLMRYLNDTAAVNIILRRFQQALPFGVHTVKVERLGCILYRKQRVAGPHELMRGMILEMLDIARAKNPRVRYVEYGDQDVEYRIEWDA